MSGRDSSRSVLLLKGEGDTSVTEPLQVANLLASHYQIVSGSGNYSPNFITHKKEAEQDTYFLGAEEAVYNIPISLEEVDEALRNANDSAPGGDDIPYALIRNLPHKAKKQLLDLYNCSFEQGNYPQVWKEATIVPVRKEGKDPNLSSSYRPISLLSCLGKVLESVINARIVWFLERGGHLSYYQAGFRKKFSAIDHLVKLENLIQDAFLDGEHSLGVFFDMESAYDTTWRHGVLLQLRSWGIRGRLLRIVASFLQDRIFRVRVGGALSDPRVQENGIPQGSVLSVTLFAVAINGIADHIPPEIHPSLFVDDLSILLRGNDPAVTAELIQAAITAIAGEAELRGFRFSVAKTTCVLFTRARQTPLLPELILNGRVIPLRDNVRFLGLILDRELRWRSHIDYLVETSLRGLNVLRVVAQHKWGADQELLISLLCALVRTRLEYGSQVFSSARKSHLKRLDAVFNKGLRIVTGAHFTTPSFALCRLAGVPPLSLRRTQVLTRYGERLRAFPSHPAHELVSNPPRLEDYRRLPTRTRPLSLRLVDCRVNLDMTRHDVIAYVVPDIPPWTLQQTDVDCSLLRHGRKQTDPTILKSLFLERDERYEGWNHIFTDGSKTNQGVAFAVVYENEVWKFRLPSCASIFTAEMWALRKALELIEQKEGERWLVCTDSASSVVAIQDIFASDPLVRSFLECLSKIRQQEKEVVILWVPSHVGILGNEMADSAAREAIDLLTDPLPIRLEDQLREDATIISHAWRETWVGGETQLCQVLPHLDPVPWPASFKRTEVRKLQRIATGHTSLTHNYLLAGGPRPRCPKCRGPPFTVQHVAVECPALQIARTRHQLQGPLKLMFSSAEEIKKVRSFLLEAKLYYGI